MHHRPLFRFAVLVLALAVLAASGCRWFRKDSPFEQSAETRPLEVPPDLDRPNTDSAVGASSSVARSTLSPAQPAGATATTTPAPAAGAPQSAPAGAVGSGFTVAGERDAIFARVGEALAAVPGVAVASKAQLLGTYDVTYENSSFLVRVTKVDAGVYVSAVDPRGVPATDAAAAKLMASLRSALGG
jgi:uncharacterized lipoprotein